MTVKIDQIADAIISAPGSRVSIIDTQHGSDTTTSSTFVTCDASVTQVNFYVPIAGKYKISLTTDCYIASTTGTARFRIAIDEGTANEQVTPDTTPWDIQLNDVDSVKYKTFQYEFELPVGNHTFELQWRRSAGTGTLTVTSDGSIQCDAVLIAGSGAGGELIEDANPANTAINLDRGALTTVVSDTITISENDAIQVDFTGWAQKIDSSIDAYLNIFLYADGNIIGQSTTYGLIYIKPTTTATTSRDNVSFSRRIEGLGAGAHTIEVRGFTFGGGGGNDYDVYPTSFQLSVARGGLVPIQQDGYDVVGQPRALNFIGAGVYSVTDEYGVVNIELNQSVTALGSLISVSAPQPVSNIVISSSYTQFFPDSSGYSTLNVSVAGLYRVTFSGVVWGDGAVGTAQLEMRIDEGESNAKTIGGDTDNSWRTRVHANAISSFTVVGEVELTVGTHILRVYGKNIIGAGPTIWGSSLAPGVDMIADFMLVTGSGAGGTLVDQVSVTNTYSDTITTLYPSWQTVQDGYSDVSITNISVSEGEVLLCVFRGSSYESSGTQVTRNLGISYDDGATGATETIIKGSGSYQNYEADGGFTIVTPPLSAGVYTFKLKGARSSHTSDFVVMEDSNLSIHRYRGGLVPIRNNSQTIIDKPAAIDFVGDNVQVTNVGGTAKVSFNGVAEGTISEKVALQADFTTSSTSFVDVDNGGGDALELTFDAISGENVLAYVRATVTSSGTHGFWFVFELDGTEIEETKQGDHPYTSSAGNLSFSYVLEDLSAGSHTLKLKAKTSSSTLTIEGSSTDGRGVAALGIMRFRGGYIQPENVPVLSNIDGYLYRYVLAPGAANELYITMNDGVRYKSNSPIQMDLNSTGLGGREVSANLVSGTWYYNYSVPDSNNSGYFSIIASDQHPGLGPTDYTAWRYLGAVYYINATNLLRKVIQIGNQFTYLDPTEDNLVLYDSGDYGDIEVTPPTGSWYSFNASGTGPGGVGLQRPIENAIPLDVAVAFDLVGNVDTDSGEQYAFFAESGQVKYTPRSSWSNIESFLSLDTGTRVSTTRLTSLYQKDAFFRWEANSSGPLNFTFGARGYIDGYLTNLESQKQAIYVPDSQLPRLVWTSITEIDIKAAAGQSSIVKMTLQDGKERTFNGTLQWDPSTGVIDGGLDTGSEASSTWYYLYLVPRSSDDDFLHIRASINTPDLGPTSYSNHRYIGAVYNDRSSNIVRFYQSGAQFNYASLKEPASIAALTKTNYVDPADSYNISDAVPATASIGFFNFRVTRDTSAPGFNILGELFVDGYVDTTSTHGTESSQRFAFVQSGDDTSDSAGISVEVPLPTDPKKIGYRVYCNTAGPLISPQSHYLDVSGWIDGYLGMVGIDSRIAGGGSGTLDQAYNEGHIIEVDEGPVEFTGTDSATYVINVDGYAIFTGDVEISTALKGVILKSDNGTRYRVTIDNSGNLTTTAI